MFRIELFRNSFDAIPRTVLSNEEFEVTTKVYSTGVESLILANSRGHVEILPFMGQIVWDAVFDGISLRMKNMFAEPRHCTLIEDTYGCFAFHSGLLGAGCPAPEDSHPLHGEFACAQMDRAWLEIGDDSVSISGSFEYVKGFGDHYRACPKVTLASKATTVSIEMDVVNLSDYQSMPLQYMCHMNYAYVDGATLTENIPEGSFHIRESIPAHVHPTPAWTAFNEAIKKDMVDTTILADSQNYNPEIVFFADDLPQYGENMQFNLQSPQGFTFRTEFSSDQFQVATRWILWNADQQVAAFVLPGTSRPEGREAARRAGTLIELGPRQTRHFCVVTGVRTQE